MRELLSWRLLAALAALFIYPLYRDNIRALIQPDILADAAWLIFNKPSREFTGKFLIDDTFLVSEGRLTPYLHRSEVNLTWRPSAPSPG